MKHRSMLPGFALLLLLGLVGSAARPALADPSVSPLSVTGAPSCATATSSMLFQTASPPQGLPATLTCGACSDTPCQGAVVSANCGYFSGGIFYTGRCLVLDMCSDNTRSCFCGNNQY